MAAMLDQLTRSSVRRAGSNSVGALPSQIPYARWPQPIPDARSIPIIPRAVIQMHQNTPLDARALPTWSSSCSSATTSRMIVLTFISTKRRNFAPISA